MHIQEMDKLRRLIFCGMQILRPVAIFPFLVSWVQDQTESETPWPYRGLMRMWNSGEHGYRLLQKSGTQ